MNDIKITTSDEAKKIFWDLWKANKNHALSNVLAESHFGGLFSWASNNFEEFKETFGKYAAFAANILTRRRVVHTASYAFLGREDEDLAERHCFNKDLWILGA